MTNKRFGGSGLERSTLDWIHSHLSKGDPVLEFGAGLVSTRELAARYDLISVEHDPQWVKEVQARMFGGRIIEAPIDNGWYDQWAIIRNISGFHPKLVLIDGPVEDRSPIIEHLNLIMTARYIVVHDTYRPRDIVLARAIAHALKLNLDFYAEGNDFWGVIS